MDWPIQPVEIQRRFVPRFCPWRECSQHTADGGSSAPRAARLAAALAPEPFSYKKVTAYSRKDGSTVPRYRCRSCKRTFSKQTFSTTYYLKRRELLVPVAAGLQAGSAHRQIARSLRCAPSTVTRLSARLGRHALLLHASALSELHSLDEAVVFDHMEVFARSQDYPFGIATPVGSQSWFVYGLDPAPHARTGRTSPAQKARLRAKPRQNFRGGYRASVKRMLDLLLGIPSDSSKSTDAQVGSRDPGDSRDSIHSIDSRDSIDVTEFKATPSSPLELITDGHEDYRRVLASKPYRLRVHHKVYPNPKRGPKGSPRSAWALVRDRAMFPNDQFHALVRHTVAHHRRETIAFGRRLNAVMERMFLTVVWKNFVKGVSERKPDPTTPAMRRGLATAPWKWPRVFARRLFPDRISVSKGWLELYRREWITPGGPNARHELTRAF